MHCIEFTTKWTKNPNGLVFLGQTIRVIRFSLLYVSNFTTTSLHRVRVPCVERDVHHALRRAHPQAVLGPGRVRVRRVQVRRDAGRAVLGQVLRGVPGE